MIRVKGWIINVPKLLSRLAIVMLFVAEVLATIQLDQMERRGGETMTALICTAIICTTLVILAVISKEG